MTDLTRAERVEEYKMQLDEEISRLRGLQETVIDQDLNEWLRLDHDIDALYTLKDNAATEIDEAIRTAEEVDPRTPEQRAWDEDAAEIEATRTSDYPM